MEVRVYRYLFSCRGEWRTNPQIAKALGEDKDSITPRMAPMLRKRWIERKEHDYGFNDKGNWVQLLHHRVVPIERTDTMTFDLGTRIKQVRALEAKIKAEEAALEAKLKDAKDWAVAARVEILEFLNATKQKSANTEFGTAYWKPKVTYRVEDKDEFRRHVIGMEQWELVTWGAAGNAAEVFTNEHGEPPPGCVRNSVNILYINPPVKPRAKVAKASTGNGAEPPDDDALAEDLGVPAGAEAGQD